MATTTRHGGRLHAQAAQFDKALLARETAAADQMLAAWTESYKGVRQELDGFLAKVAKARAEGVPTSPAWAYQERRLKDLLDKVRGEVTRYAADASTVARATQAAAIRDAADHAAKLTGTAAVESLGVVGTIATADPRALIRTAVGFTGDGSTLATHLAKTLTGETVDNVRDTIVKGLALGKGQDWFVREVTRNYALSHVRATTIMRTETLRVYRETSRATYQANRGVLEGWVWQAHLDGATCIACALMDGTLHDVDDTLDGHPRCRCAMIPRTKSWEDLGVPGLEDTRPPMPSGEAWVNAQPPDVQRALMGPSKFDAWKRGEIDLQDMVAQHHSDDWGTMRTERSLKSITEGRNPNPAPAYVEDGAKVPKPTTEPANSAPAIEPDYVDRLTSDLREGKLTRKQIQDALDDPNVSDLGKANGQAALARHDAEVAAAKVKPSMKVNLTRRPPTVAEPVVPKSAVPSNLPKIPDSTLEALQPVRGGYYTNTRDKTLKLMNETPEGKRLHKTLLNFQQGGSNAIPRLRTDILHLLEGTGDLAPGRQENLRELLAAIDQSPTGGKTLFRGMEIPGSLDDVLAAYKEGDTLDLSLASFSTDQGTATSFAQNSAGQRVKGKIRTPLLVEWLETDNALPIQNLAKSNLIAQEKEWLVRGQFEIVSTKKVKRGGKDFVKVVIRRKVGA